jgi:hypothetical protein
VGVNVNDYTPYVLDVTSVGPNDILMANTTGNNMLVAGLSTGKTGAPAAPRLSSGSGSNLFIAGSVDCALAPLAPSGRLGQLDDRRFTVRQKATAELLQIGQQAGPAMDKALAAT